MQISVSSQSESTKINQLEQKIKELQLLLQRQEQEHLKNELEDQNCQKSYTERIQTKYTQALEKLEKAKRDNQELHDQMQSMQNELIQSQMFLSSIDQGQNLQKQASVEKINQQLETQMQVYKNNELQANEKISQMTLKIDELMNDKDATCAKQCEYTNQIRILQDQVDEQKSMQNIQVDSKKKYEEIIQVLIQQKHDDELLQQQNTELKANFQKDNEKLHLNIGILTQKLTQLQIQMQRIGVVTNQHQLENQTLQRQLSDIKTLKCSLEQKVYDIQQQSELKIVQQKTEYDKNITSMTEQHQKCKNQIVSQNIQISDLNSQVLKLQDEIQSKSNLILSQQGNNDKIQLMNMQYQNQIDEMKEKMNDLSLENQNLLKNSKEHQRIEAEILQKEKIILDFQDKYENMCKQNQQLQKQIYELKLEEKQVNTKAQMIQGTNQKIDTNQVNSEKDNSKLYDQSALQKEISIPIKQENRNMEKPKDNEKIKCQDQSKLATLVRQMIQTDQIKNQNNQFKPSLLQKTVKQQNNDEICKDKNEVCAVDDMNNNDQQKQIAKNGVNTQENLELISAVSLKNEIKESSIQLGQVEVTQPSAIVKQDLNIKIVKQTQQIQQNVLKAINTKSNIIEQNAQITQTEVITKLSDNTKLEGQVVEQKADSVDVALLENMNQDDLINKVSSIYVFCDTFYAIAKDAKQFQCKICGICYKRTRTCGLYLHTQSFHQINVKRQFKFYQDAETMEQLDYALQYSNFQTKNWKFNLYQQYVSTTSGKFKCNICHENTQLQFILCHLRDIHNVVTIDKQHEQSEQKHEQQKKAVASRKFYVKRHDPEFQRKLEEKFDENHIKQCKKSEQSDCCREAERVSMRKFIIKHFYQINENNIFTCNICSKQITAVKQHFTILINHIRIVHSIDISLQFLEYKLANTPDQKRYALKYKHYFKGIATRDARIWYSEKYLMVKNGKSLCTLCKNELQNPKLLITHLQTHWSLDDESEAEISEPQESSHDKESTQNQMPNMKAVRIKKFKRTSKHIVQERNLGDQQKDGIMNQMNLVTQLKNEVLKEQVLAQQKQENFASQMGAQEPCKDQTLASAKDQNQIQKCPSTVQCIEAAPQNQQFSQKPQVLDAQQSNFINQLQNIKPPSFLENVANQQPDIIASISDLAQQIIKNQESMILKYQQSKNEDKKVEKGEGNGKQ